MFRKSLLFSSIFIILLFFTTRISHAFFQDSRTTKVTVIPENVTLDKDFQILFGKKVEVLGKVKGDLIVIASEILVKGNIEGDLIAVGNNLEIFGTITQDARIISGNAIIDGEITKNLTVIGGNIEIGKQGRIGKGVLVLGGTLFVESPINGFMKVATGKTEVSSSIVEGDIYSSEFLLKEEGVIKGNVNYYGAKNAYIAEGSKITGRLRQEISKEIPSSSKQMLMKSFENFRLKVTVFSFFITYTIGILIVNLFPNLSLRVVKTLESKFLNSLFYGVMLSLILPTVAIFFAFTIIGVPFTFIIFSFLILVAYLSKIVVSLFIGMKVIPILRVDNVYIKLFIGLLVYYLFAYNLIFGVPLLLISFILSLGCLFIIFRSLYQSGRSKSLL